MKRRIIEIDQEKCNGCGRCASACHEGAIGMAGGKAKLLREDYCEALGDCLPSCPTGAIAFTEREAAQYDKKAVMLSKAIKPGSFPAGCPGSNPDAIGRRAEAPDAKPAKDTDVSQLRQWPVQIKLAPVSAPYFNGAKLLIAADCTAYARADFHDRFIRNRITLIGCPKLDGVDYADKLTEILKDNEISSVTVVRMEVPCCGGIENAVKTALQRSGKMIPWQVITLAASGEILDR